LEQRETARIREELQILRPKIQLADVEFARATFQMKQLENQLAEIKEVNQKLSHVQEVTPSASARKQPVFSDFIADQRLGASPILEKDKDNLKMISGIGPVIEKKLNTLGIYTFRQISEFTPQTIDHVTSSIKFFPDRIGRDNWIGQAAALARHRR
jgi:predicted flap endonuclease-1-like 5' DNA nuclease